MIIAFPNLPAKLELRILEAPLTIVSGEIVMNEPLFYDTCAYNSERPYRVESRHYELQNFLDIQIFSRTLYSAARGVLLC